MPNCKFKLIFSSVANAEVILNVSFQSGEGKTNFLFNFIFVLLFRLEWKLKRTKPQVKKITRKKE